MLDAEVVLDASRELDGDDEAFPLLELDIDDSVVADGCVGPPEAEDVGAVPALLEVDSVDPLDEYAPGGVLLMLEAERMEPLEEVMGSVLLMLNVEGDEYTEMGNKLEDVDPRDVYASTVLLLTDVDEGRVDELVVEFSTVGVLVDVLFAP
ncbi:hypothetical protein LTR85_008599 [Meristemomyces frigidus]|nr:hypothetical protein LTR85_008599 [Meristemomyces frigidus]